MARTETILQLFLASPDDLVNERDVVKKVVDEFNLTWRKNFGISIELLRWETHAYPDVGGSAQDIINKQIDNDYDIFVGIMWTKFGSPTGRYDSGTEEEFRNAYKRYRENRAYPKILFYFKTQGVDLDKIDLDQLQKIKDFQSNIGDEGTLYWKFKTEKEFEDLLRVHLARIVQNWRHTVQHNEVDSIPNQPESQNDFYEESEELGFLDLILEAYEDMEKSTHALEQIAEATQQIGEDLNNRTCEIETLGELDDHKKLKQAKRISNATASDMENFVNRLKAEIPIFTQRYQNAVRKLTKSISFLEDFGAKDIEGLENLKSGIENHEKMLADVMPQIESFKNMVDSLPRVTVRFKKAKRATVDVLNELLEEMNKARVLLQETTKTIKETIET